MLLIRRYGTKFLCMTTGEKMQFMRVRAMGGREGEVERGPDGRSYIMEGMGLVITPLSVKK
jgi:hypothetical protein